MIIEHLVCQKKYDLKLFPRVDAIVTISDECLEILKEEVSNI